MKKNEIILRVTCNKEFTTFYENINPISNLEILHFNEATVELGHLEGLKEEGLPIPVSKSEGEIMVFG